MNVNLNRLRRESHWKLRTRTLRFGPRPLLMGIVNVTPDSFSDGGKFSNTTAAVEYALRLAREGADLLDIGGESTRPYSTPVDAEEEMRRVLPVIQGICTSVDVPVSIDTSKPDVARKAIENGVEVINDVDGFENTEMIEIARNSGVGICAMHMQNTPQTMQDHPVYDDVVKDVYCYLKNRRDALTSAGIDREHICLDPGIGFGKTHAHNLTLLSNCAQFHQLDCALLIGHSRKGFIANVFGDKTRDRTAGTIGVTLAIARQGVQIVRVHDVQPNHDALLMFEAAGALSHIDR